MAMFQGDPKEVVEVVDSLASKTDFAGQEMLGEVEWQSIPTDVKSSLQKCELGQWVLMDPLKIAWKIEFWQLAGKPTTALRKLQLKVQQMQLVEMAIIVAALGVFGQMAKVEMVKLVELSLGSFVAVQLAKITKQLEFVKLLQMKMWQELNHVLVIRPHIYKNAYRDIYRHAYMYTQIHVYIHIDMYIDICICVCIHTYIHIYVYLWM